MPQNYRIYINDNTLTIGKKLPTGDGVLQQLDIQNFDFPTFYKKQKKASKTDFYLPADDPKEVFRRLKKSCEVVKAAGGLVLNQDDAYLFIFRNGKWDLPKGKVEKKENSRAAGIREVEEECGVNIDDSGKKICKTYHVYTWDNDLILKRTNWYKMQVKGKVKLKPQKEEGITKAMWVTKKGVSKKIKNTYPLIIEVLEKGKALK